MAHEKVPRVAVLVVDDEPLIRWSLSEALTDSGWTVRQASTGVDTRAVLRSLDGQPLVVVLDLRLPDVADLSLLEEVRRARPDAPVIMMSAHGNAEQASAARSLGAFKFVTKPFDLSAMVSLVEEAWQTSGR